LAKKVNACVIGAGSSGIAVCKALHERGLPFDCFELSDDVGGVWYYENPTGLSAAYRSLHINTSKQIMQFSDFPMPAEWPVYTHHAHIHQYFRDYVDHFGFRDKITFNTGVEHCTRRADGVWEVRLSTGETREYDCLFVCNGHHWDPRWPEPPFPGEFHGNVMHAHDYRTPEFLTGKRLLLLGLGNSAMDIAVEASYLAEKVYLAARGATHIFPKYLWGVPTDHWLKPWAPSWLAQPVFTFMLRVQQGKVENYGLPKPAHGLMQAHPTISSTILDRIGHGAIVPKPNIAALEGDSVRFTDGSVEKVDVIIYCTGYKVTFPFFDSTFLAAHDNDLPLYRRMMKPGINNLFFIGLYQPLGAIFPLAEVQGVIAAEYLRGRYLPPPDEEMERDIEAERAAMFKRYLKSKRHTMQVDYYPFMRQLHRELKAGAARALRAGRIVPLVARARQDTETAGR
jgi:dimethylaniline monooxygenase (N-oxide forming)